MPGLAKVKIREPEERFALISISEKEQIDISRDIYDNWQKLLDMVGKLLDVPSGLIMRIHEKEIEVYLKSNDKDNPYEVSERAELGDGLYCETVLGTNSLLNVPNSLDTEIWRDNPDIELNMVSYLGLPLVWPDSEKFGTICVLDSKTRHFTDLQIELLKAIQDIINKDLKIINEYSLLKKSLSQEKLLLQEMTHRVKNNFNSLIATCTLLEKDDLEVAEQIKQKLYSYVSIFDQLTYKSNGVEVELISFLRSLLDRLLSSPQAGKITYNVLGSEVFLNPEQISLVGQIIAELVINSEKYAYPEHGTGNINITVSYENGKISVLYSDGGVGFDEEFIIKKEGSIGWQIMQSIIKSMKGSIEFMPGPGGNISFGMALL